MVSRMTVLSRILKCLRPRARRPCRHGSRPPKARAGRPCRGRTAPPPRLAAETAAPVAPDQAIVSGTANWPRKRRRSKTCAPPSRGLTDCSLKRSAQRTVLADGNPQARLMSWARDPGGDEDGRGCPSLAVPGNCWTACWRPFPSTGQAFTSPTSCRVAAAGQPHADDGGHGCTACPSSSGRSSSATRRRLFASGGYSMQNLLGINEGDSLKSRGRWVDYPLANGSKIKAIATLHPAYLVSRGRRSWRGGISRRSRKALAQTSS